jgi:hypothetical protein
MKKLTVAGLAVTGLLITSSVASAQVCAIPLVIVGAITSVSEHRELTQKEAMFCGLYHETVPPKKAANNKKKSAKKKM